MKYLALATIAATLIGGATLSTTASALPVASSQQLSVSGADVVQVRMHRRHRMHRRMGMRSKQNTMIMNSERKENGMSSGGTRPPNLSR